MVGAGALIVRNMPPEAGTSNREPGIREYRAAGCARFCSPHEAKACRGAAVELPSLEGLLRHHPRRRPVHLLRRPAVHKERLAQSQPGQVGERPRVAHVPVGDAIDRLILRRRDRQSLLAGQALAHLAAELRAVPAFRALPEYFEHVYLGRQWTNLSDLNQTLIKHISREFLGIEPSSGTLATTRPPATSWIGFSSWWSERRNQLRFGALRKGIHRPRAVPTGRGRAGVEGLRRLPGISAAFPAVRPQGVDLDLLFNCGPQSGHYIWGWRETS